MGKIEVSGVANKKNIIPVCIDPFADRFCVPIKRRSASPFRMVSGKPHLQFIEREKKENPFWTYLPIVSVLFIVASVVIGLLAITELIFG